MPTCNKINCSIILPPTDTPLPEYRRTYLDSSVSVYVPVPDIPILHAAPSFNIQLWTDSYVAPGLAMFVYIDGHYQCNRSKRMPPPDSVGGSSVKMRLRQKEEKLAGGEGDFVGREWRWVHFGVDPANGAANTSRDAQDRIGKIEIVVLRCDEDNIPAEKTRARTPPNDIPAMKTPRKAPPDRVPSAKVPSAASEGFGAMIGLFDGACDFGSTGAGDDNDSDSGHDTPLDGHIGREWDAIIGQYAFSEHYARDHSDSKNQFIDPSPQGSEHCFLPIGLDGQEYEYPGFIVNQYGQLYDPRVPYSHPSGAYRPRNIEQKRHVDVSVTRDSITSAPTRPVSQSQLTEKHKATAPRAAACHAVHAEQEPQIFIGTDGQRYLKIVDPRPATAQAPAYVSVPQDASLNVPQIVSHIKFDPQAQPQGEATRHDAPRDGQPDYLDPAKHIRYVTHGKPARYHTAHQHRNLEHHPHEQQQSYTAYIAENIAEQGMRELPTIDPEYQRFLIFQMPEKIEALLEVDYRLVADAVPYMPQLQKTLITKLGFAETQKLKRNLKQVLDRGFYPNGDIIGDLDNPYGREARFSRQSSYRRQSRSGIKYSEIKSESSGPLKDVAETIKSSKLGSRRGDKSGYDRIKDGSSPSSSFEHFADSNQSQGRSKKSGGRKSGERNGGSSKHEVSRNEGRVANSKGMEASGGWDQQQNSGCAHSHSITNAWEKPSEGHGGVERVTTSCKGEADDWNNATNAVEGIGSRNPPSHYAPSSHRSVSPTPTNPHAHVQPYFQTWRGNGQTSNTRPLSRQPREPYTYLPTPTPHVPASQVGDRSHGVRADKGANYTHRVRRPKYLDTMEDPYAVFVFNYRSAEKLEEILHQDVKGDLKLVADEVGRGVLMNLPRERLVDELMKIQAKEPEVEFVDVSRSAGRAESRVRSTRSASHRHERSGTSIQQAPAAQPTTQQSGRLFPEPNRSVKSGKAAAKSGWDINGAGPLANIGWVEEGKGAVTRGDGFKPDKTELGIGFTGW